ncbi:MAG: hypothetical protein AAF907_00530 [Planctomycetota bacterium]
MFGPVLISLLALQTPPGAEVGPPSAESARASVPAVEPEILPAGTDPLPPGLTYPDWHRTELEREAATEAERKERAGLLVAAENWPPTPEAAATGRATLRRMAEFLSAQPSVRFTLEYDLNRQSTMGVVETGNNPAEYYDFVYAQPNLFRASDRRPRSDKYHWEIASDGESFLRTVGGTVFVEPAPGTLVEMLRRPGFDPSWAYYVDARGVMSLFDPWALAEWTAGRQVGYAGVRQFGETAADYVVIEAPDPNATSVLYKKWHVFLSRGPRPVPLLIVRDGDKENYWSADDGDDVSNPRGFDTEWRFTNWSFNEPDVKRAFGMTMPEQQLVESPDDLAHGDRTSLPRFVGSQLPEFTARDERDDIVRLTDFAEGRPFVLLLWNDEVMFHRRWRAASAAEAKFGENRVKTYALYIGRENDPEERRSLFEGLADPEVLKEREVVVPPRFLSRCSERRLLQEMRGVTSGRCVVVDAAGTIVDTQPSYGRTDFRQMTLTSVSGLLKERDVVADQQRMLDERNAARAERVERWEAKFRARAAALR